MEYTSSLPHGQKYLSFEIRGHVEGEIDTEISLIFRNEDESVLATYSYCTDKEKLLHLCGDFDLTARISLPFMLHAGNLFVDLFFHKPNLCYYLKAPKCCSLICEGFRTPFGQVNRFRNNGLMELGNDDSFI